MSSHKDWHAIEDEDLRTTSEEDDDNQSDFDFVRDDSEATTNNDVAESTLNSSEDSDSTHESQMDTDESDAESENSSQSDDQSSRTMDVPPLETAFAAGDVQAQEEDKTPIAFDADEAVIESIAGLEQDRWQMTNAYMRDMQQAFRNRPAVRVQGNERYMKILLVGEQGLGKESFIKNVFAPYCGDNDLAVNVCEVDTKLKGFREEPSNFCTEVVIDVDEGRTKIHYNMQDTPGTHQPGHLPVILEHVRNQNRDYMAMEEDSRRNVPLGTLPDPRVDVALYFLSPFFLKPQDITAMTALAKFVPVIPLIAKADALTTAELTSYRNEIKERLQSAEEKAGHPIMQTFGNEQLKQAGAVRDVPPFAIITSSEIDTDVGRHWFTRTFPWGKCEVMSSNHSDLPALKSLLFEECFESIKAATESRFYAARESFLTARALSKAMSSKDLPPTSPPAAPLRMKGSLAETAAAVQASVPSKPKPTKPQKSSSWGWGWTAGLVTAAVLLQLLALSYYSSNMTNLKTLVDTYQAESAAEKQVFQEMLRERLYAIEHKPQGWSYGSITPIKEVGEFFTLAGGSVKAASFHTASAIRSSAKSGSKAVASSLTSQTAAFGSRLQKAYIHTIHGTKQGLTALPKISQQAAKSVGLSLKKGSHTACRAIATQLSKGGHSTAKSFILTWKVLSERLASQTASFSQHAKTAFSSMGRGLQTGFRHMGHNIRDSLSHSGRSCARGTASMRRGLRTASQKTWQVTLYGFQASSKGIASGSRNLVYSTWNSLKSSDKAFSRFGSSIAQASRRSGSSMASASRVVGTRVSEFGQIVSSSLGKGATTTGKALQKASFETKSAISSFAQYTATSTHKVWNSCPNVKQLDSWYSQNSKSITRILRRAAVANVLQ